MTAVLYGNPWHGQLTPAGMIPAGGSLVTSVQGNNAAGGETTFPYVPPVTGENLGFTYYYKQPAIAAVVTPSAVTSTGGQFMNDAILFGNRRRYSPFGGGAMLGDRQWLHYGADGKWRIMSLTVVSLGSETTIVQVFRGGQFGVINKEVAAESTMLAELTLAGRVCSNTVLSDVDARYDGRRILVHLRGKWTNLVDASSPSGSPPPYENQNERAIAAVWRIDVADDCTGATATRIWLAADPVGAGAYDRSWYEPAGALYFEAGRYYQPFSGIYQLEFDFNYSFERLVGAAFAADGTVHLIKYVYTSALIGAWSDVTGHSDQGVTPVEFEPHGGDLPFIKSGTGVFVPHAAVVSYNIEIQSNGAVLKTMTALPDPPLYAVTLTNNAFELRDSGQSLCRVAPGCIDDTAISGTSPFVSFNPRTGTVHSSGADIGFV